jgi:hypothetical protein
VGAGAGAEIGGAVRINKAYWAVQHWVDRTWQGTNAKVLLLPAFVPSLIIMLIARDQAKNGLLLILQGCWFLLWNGFVAWRGWIKVRADAREADHYYDNVGKYRLSTEYHDSESATAAKRRKDTEID